MDQFQYTTENENEMCKYTNDSADNINKMYKYEIDSAKKIEDKKSATGRTFEDILETTSIAGGASLITSLISVALGGLQDYIGTTENEAKNRANNVIRDGVIAAVGGGALGGVIADIDSDMDFYTLMEDDEGDISFYNKFNRAGNYLDDILWGLPGKGPLGENRYIELEKCIPIEEEEGDYIGEVPSKYMYIRGKPKGDALSRMGLAKNNSTSDKGLLFSVAEDILDLDPIRLGKMMTTDSRGPKYKNCQNVPITDKTAKFYDSNDNLIPKPNKDSIEMFTNNKNGKYGKYGKLSIYLISILFIILIIIILYKLLK